MALVDTGLGWYADGNWLSQAAENIGSLSRGGSIPDPPQPTSGSLDYKQPIPMLSDQSQYQSGCPMWDFYGIRYAWTTNSSSIYVAAYNGGGYMVAVSDEVTTFRINANDPFNVRNPYQYGGVTYYYYFSPITGTAVSTWPIFDTRDDAIIACIGKLVSEQQVTIPYSKVSAGVAVTCMAKWNSVVGGDVYFSPVLISTEQNNTLFTRDNASPSVSATEHTFLGTTFYMRKAPLDVLDGTETITANFPIIDLVEEETYNTNDDIFRLICIAAGVGVGPVPEDDPYAPGGTSGAGGGEDATFDFTSTDIPVPSLPSTGASNTGFLSLYKPSAGELQSLATYMWSGAFDLDNFRKLVANPMDAILGLHIIPTISGHPATSSATLKVGNISTGLSMDQITEQYYELDCGTINVEPKWGAYLDYAPYSKLTLYLPYVGFVPISPDDCMNGSIKVVYHVDILSGACCVYVYCTSNRGADSHVLYTYTGACACDCPVTEGQYTNAVLGILGVAGGVAGAISSWAQGSAAGVTGGIENAANAALSMFKPDIGRSGSFGGSAGIMGIQYPYLVLTVPRMCIPGDQQILMGYPSFITKTLGSLVGYNTVQVSRLTGMSCTQAEADEIITLLGEGAIF